MFQCDFVSSTQTFNGKQITDFFLIDCQLISTNERFPNYFSNNNNKKSKPKLKRKKKIGFFFGKL